VSAAVLVVYTLNLFRAGLAGRSGLVVTRLSAAREGPGSNRTADRSLCFTKITVIRSFGHWLHTDCSAYRSTQPSTLRGTVNEYQPHG